MRDNEDVTKVFLSAILLLVAAAVTGAILPELPFTVRLLCFLPSYAIAGYDVIKRSVLNIKEGEIFDENLLMTVATLGALAMGDFAEATFVMLFFKVGEIFEEIAEKRSERSLEALLKIRPDRATVIVNGAEVEKPAKDVGVGETVLVIPGERIPLDGVVISGQTEIDASSLTGESAPVRADRGDPVYSGTVNLLSPLRIRTTATADGSAAAKIIELVKNAGERKAKTERFITGFARVYTPAVVALAVIIAVVPSLISGGWRSHIYSALTFLVVSCPCALVVSVPLAFFGAIGCASRKGILVKGSDALERLSAVNAAVFDKTGTLTKGSFEVVAVHPNIVGEQDILKLAAAVEAYSVHPIAKSIVAHYNGAPAYFADNIKNLSGMGVSAEVEGNTVLIGNERLMRESGVACRECHRSGTVVHVALDGKYLGHIVISDELRDEASETVAQLKEAGVEPVMLTGDNGDTAKETAVRAGIENYKYRLLPENKVGELESIIESGKRVAFIGDGVNDAPALARADVGIAMGGLGSDAAIEAADIVITDDNIGKIPLLIKIARKAVGISKENIAFSIGIKVGILLPAAFGVPKIMWFAAFADVGVLVAAVLNAMRTMMIKGEKNAR